MANSFLRRAFRRGGDQVASEVENRSLVSISDPALAEWFGVGNPNYAGVSVGEGSSLGLSAFWRATSLIAGTIASLPLHTLRDTEDGRVRVSSVFDNPGGAEGLTRFEWVETVVTHVLMFGNCFLAHVYNGAGGLAALVPIHPLAVAIETDQDAPGGKLFKVTLQPSSNAIGDVGEVRTFTQLEMTHIPGLSTDGLRGHSLISIARNSLGTAIAGDRAAARMFGSGPLVSGIVTSKEDITEAEAKTIKEGLNANLMGVDNAGEIAFVNRNLEFTQWSMTHADAQWLESRQFQIEEIARWTGVPPHLLMQTEKQTSWGTGVAEQNRGLARYTLQPYTARIEQRLSRLLPSPRFVEFDMAGLLRPAPEQEIPLLIQQVEAGLLTPNEARRIRNMDPIEGGDALRSSAPLDVGEATRSADELLDEMDSLLKPESLRSASAGSRGNGLVKGSPEAKARMAHARAAKAAKRAT